MFVDFLIGYIVACYNEIGLCAQNIDIGSKFVTLIGVSVSDFECVCVREKLELFQFCISSKTSNSKWQTLGFAFAIWI